MHMDGNLYYYLICVYVVYETRQMA